MAEELQVEEIRETEDILEEDNNCLSVQCANDHDTIKGIYKRYRAPGTCAQERQALIADLMRLLSAHIEAEEQVLCPALAQEVSEAASHRALSVDASLKLLLEDLEAMRVGQAGFNHKLDQLMQVFFEHMAGEEHAMPALRAAAGDGKLLELGGRFRTIKDGALARSLPPPPAATA